MAEVTITIKNWDKYNPKRDQKSYTWLRLDNDIANDTKLFGLTAEQKFMWIHLLCLASKANSGTIFIDLRQIERALEIDLTVIKDGLAFLERREILSVVTNISGVVATTVKNISTTPTYERTDVRTDERTNIATAPAVALVLDAPDPTKELIAHYCEVFKSRYGANPVIDGKSAGIAKRLLTGKSKISLQRAKDMVTTYLTMSDQWFVQRGHDLATFQSDLNKVTVKAETGFSVSRKQAEQGELLDANVQAANAYLAGSGAT